MARKIGAEMLLPYGQLDADEIRSRLVDAIERLASDHGLTVTAHGEPVSNPYTHAKSGKVEWHLISTADMPLPEPVVRARFIDSDL